MIVSKKIPILIALITSAVILQASFITSSGCTIIPATAKTSWAAHNAYGDTRHDEASIPLVPFISNRLIIRNPSTDRLMVGTQPESYLYLTETYRFSGRPGNRVLQCSGDIHSYSGFKIS
jgi:hypothetical protein